MTVFTISPERGFLRTLARGLLTRHPCPDDLARVTVFLPNRRSVLALRRIFLAEADRAEALLLPRIVPLGEGDVDELTLREPMSPSLLLDGDGDVEDEKFRAAREKLLPLLSSPPKTARRLLLAKLVAARRPEATDASAAALSLAEELERLLDHLESEGVSISTTPDLFESIVPDDLARSWQESLKFLRILSHHWPSLEREHGLLTGARARSLIADARLEVWRARPPEHLVVAAGSTGTVRSTARLLEAVSRLERGEVILPGLDLAASDDEWNAILRDPVHPQYAMASLLDAHLGVARGDVREWDAAGESVAPSWRRDALRGALAPASVGFTGIEDLRAAKSEKPDRLFVLECKGEEHEARAIAALLRDALESRSSFLGDSGAESSSSPLSSPAPAALRAALVTHSRTLARRVAGELRRWKLDIDDSGGVPLAETSAGVFLRLTLDATEADWPPVLLLSVLKHPFARLGRRRLELQTLVARLERDYLRRPKSGADLGGIERQVRARGGDEALISLISDLRSAQSDLAVALERDDGKGAGAAGAMKAHIKLLHDLCKEEGEEREALPFLRGSVGKMIGKTLRDLEETLAMGWASDFAPAWYPAALRDRLHEESWRAPWSDSRLAILGPLEARLISADLFILGGLNEGTWPSRPAPGPWLSRRMREDLSLPSPERRIGQSAHDFTQTALAGSRVVLTWSLRQGEEPAAPSRWILRLRAFADALGGRDSVLCDLKPVLGEESSLWESVPMTETTETETTDEGGEKEKGIRLETGDIPETLRVTAIESLRRNPYEFFARHVLRLNERDPLEQELGPALWGTYLHLLASKMSRDESVLAALDRGAEDDALALALALAKKHAADWPGLREALLLRAPNWRRIARWLLTREAKARRAGAEVESEKDLSRTLAGGTVLHGRADRLERYRGAGAGRMSVIDHKSGGLPPKNAPAEGDAPQLPLLAALVMGQENPPSEIEAEYWSLSGWTGRSSNIREAFGGSADTTLAELQEKEWRRLEDELRALAAGETALDWREKNPGRGNWGAYDAAWRHLARRWEQG